MVSEIFVNLPVKNLQRSIDFFTELGFTFDQRFTDDTATCMILGDNIFAMLLTHEKFQSFTKKPIADAGKTTEVLIAVNLESKKAVNEMVEKAKAAGGTIYSEPQDHGWMYQRAFADPDGHQWEIIWSDESLLPDDM